MIPVAESIRGRHAATEMPGNTGAGYQVLVAAKIQTR